LDFYSRGLGIFFFLIFLTFNTWGTCAEARDQTRWIEASLNEWQKVRRDSLKLEPEPTPWLILFDERCVVHINPEKGLLKGAEKARGVKIAGERVRQLIVPHDGMIPLPENGEVPDQLLSFAAPY